MVNYIKSLWNGLCMVSQLTAKENTETGRTEQGEKVLFEDIPCLLVVKSDPTSQGDISEVRANAVLFVDNELAIPEGSKIKVTQNGMSAEYAFSGLSKVYNTHREIPVTLIRRWV